MISIYSSELMVPYQETIQIRSDYCSMNLELVRANTNQWLHCLFSLH